MMTRELELKTMRDMARAVPSETRTPTRALFTPRPVASNRRTPRVKLTLLVFCLLFAHESLACSCLRPDMARLEERAEFVVLAQLKENSPALGKKKYVYATIKTFKGVANERIVVWTPMFEVSCGLRARRDVPYVLFVYREDDKLMVDHCSSWPLTREHFHFTAAFNEFYRLTGTEALDPSSNDQVDSLGR